MVSPYNTKKFEVVNLVRGYRIMGVKDNLQSESLAVIVGIEINISYRKIADLGINGINTIKSSMPRNNTAYLLRSIPKGT